MQSFFFRRHLNYDQDYGNKDWLYINNFGYYRNIPQNIYTSRPEPRTDYHLLYVENGEICVNGVVVKNGEAYLFLPNEPQSYTYKQMEKNTVDAKGQLRESTYVRFHYPEHEGMRVLFLGNSITLHGVCAEIGWHNEWGMAASAEEKDYVHLLIEKIRATQPDAAFCICQVASWERAYKTGTDLHRLYESARDFGADILIMRMVENCPSADLDGVAFKRELNSLLEFLGGENVVMTTGFWHHPLDEFIVEYAEEKNYPLVTLGDLGEMDCMKAIGLFEHTGVANHPGDKGMAAIADRIFEKLEPLL